MKARREYRNRRGVEVAVLDALVDRAEEGMTVFELRAAVDADIDAIEDALAELKADGLIDVEEDDGRVRVLPAEEVLPDHSGDPDAEAGLIDRIRNRLGL
jgi:DNA-binding transcriptional ArsR family regulator